MSTKYIKYPRTYHLPFSESLQNDDRRLEDEHCFDGKEVVLTIKMDGENTTMYRNGIHARSLYQMKHPSQHWIKAHHAEIKFLIPDGWRICGENLYARHSIPYNDLQNFFQVFSIWNEKNEILSQKDAVDFCKDSGLTHVPIISTFPFNIGQCERLYKFVTDLGHEGIIIRNVESFHFDEFQTNVAKAVRKNHVQTNEHWTKTWVPNKLKG